MTDGRVFTIKLPMRMKVNKGGELESLNLNVYRNLHFYKLSFQKKAFHDFVKPLLSGLPPMEAISLHYQINPKGGSRLDTMNVGSVVDKFFSDALVLCGIVPDDDYKHVVRNDFEFGSLCPNDPHVLVTITETKPRKETPMRILLDQSEIQKALEAFVQTMGLAGATGVELTLVGDEIQAEIIMNGVISIPTTVTVQSDSTETVSDQPRKRGGRVPGSKNKPKGDNNHVATTAETGNDLDGSGDSEAGEDEGSSESTEDEAQPESTAVRSVRSSLFDSDDEADEAGPAIETNRIDSRGNPSGVSDNESSEDTDPDNEGSDTETEAAPVTEKKRPSIFDAD